MTATPSINEPAGFEAHWRRFHGDSRPIGWMLREDSELHWLRLHSLPGSKRYPGSRADWQILLDRQNRLAHEVLGDAPCWLVQAQFVVRSDQVPFGDPAEIYRATLQFGLALAYAFDEPGDEDSNDPPPTWRVYAGRTTWSPSRFEETLRSIADDVSRALWMSEADGAIFAPYDGGIDLFLPSAAAVQQLRNRYQDWLPSEGLL